MIIQSPRLFNTINMLFINGNRITDFEQLDGYDKVATLKLILPSSGRATSDGKTIPPKPLIKIPMRFTINDPNKGGQTISVVYSEFDDVPVDQHGVIEKNYQPKPYRITNVVTKITKATHSELMLALAYSPYNAANILFGDKKNVATSQPLFEMAKKGAVAKASTGNDELLLKALSYTIGDGKVSDKKVTDIYKALNFDTDLIENEDYAGMRAKVTEFAKANPAKFIELVENTMYDMAARVTDAFERGILNSNDARKIMWGEMVKDRNHKKTICQYSMTTDRVTAFTEYLVKKDTSGTDRDALLAALEQAAE